MQLFTRLQAHTFSPSSGGYSFLLQTASKNEWHRGKPRGITRCVMPSRVWGCFSKISATKSFLTGEYSRLQDFSSFSAKKPRNDTKNCHFERETSEKSF